MTRHSSLTAILVGASVLLGGATLTYYDEALPTTLNPLFARSMVDYRSHELTFDRLFYRDAVTNKLMSRVVSRFESQDDETIRLWIREDARWHDGQPVTTSDVCFTVRTLLDPLVPSKISKPYREAIRSCTVTDDGAAVIRFKKVFYNPREQLGFSLLPEHVLSGQTIAPDMEFSSHPVGSGPMEADLGRQGVQYHAYTDGHHHASVKRLLQTEGGDPVVQVRTILSGGVHGIISVAPPLRPEVAKTDDVALKSYDLRSWWFIAVNTHRGALADVRVRQALDHAIDREELRLLTIGVERHHEEEDLPCEFVSGPFVPASPYYNRQVPVVQTSDQATVNTLMSSAGAVKQAGRWTWDGEPVVLKVGMNAVLDREAPDLLSQVGNQLQRAGFDRQVYKITSDAWNRKAVTGQYESEYDLLIGKWSFGMVEDVNPIFQTRLRGKGTLNIFNYSNPEVDSLLEAFSAARTDTEARDAYHGLHATLAEDLPYLFLWRLDTKSAWRTEVRNNLIAPYYCFTEFEGWTFEG